MGNSCYCEMPDLRLESTSDDIEEIKQCKKRLDLSKIIKLQATWRGYSSRKKISFVNSNSEAQEEERKSIFLTRIFLKVADGPVKKYVGDVVDRNRQGKGIQHWADGSKYDGFWNQNLMHGLGSYLDCSGVLFKGCFFHGLPNGFGVLVKNDHQGFHGNWIQGAAHGKGIEKVFKGNSYAGDFFNGLKHGYGTLVYNNGDFYQGFFFNGFAHGLGSYVWKNGKKYSGYWKEGKKCGLGQVFYLDKLKFTGYFENNKRHGFGVVILKDRTEKQGLWDEGKFKEIPNILF